MTTPTIAVPVELLERWATGFQCGVISQNAAVKEIRDLLAQPADHSEQDLGMAWCACGDGYQARSYGAGFIAALGHCENCEAAKPATPTIKESLTVAEHLPPLIQCLRENGQQIAERAFDAQEAKYQQPQPSAAQSAPAGEREAEAAAIAEEIDWLIRQWDAKASWSGERMAELLEAAGKASEMLAAQQRTQSSVVAEELLNRCADWCDKQAKRPWYGRTAGDMVRTFMACQPLAAAPAQPAAQDQGEVQRLREALISIRAMTNADDPESYRCDDREGCLDSVHGVADAALAASTGQEV